MLGTGRLYRFAVAEERYQVLRKGPYLRVYLSFRHHPVVVFERQWEYRLLPFVHPPERFDPLVEAHYR
jgi:hypothetical protein